MEDSEESAEVFQRRDLERTKRSPVPKKGGKSKEKKSSEEKSKEKKSKKDYRSNCLCLKR